MTFRRYIASILALIFAVGAASPACSYSKRGIRSIDFYNFTFDSESWNGKVNAPPPKGGGFMRRLKVASVGSIRLRFPANILWRVQSEERGVDANQSTIHHQFIRSSFNRNGRAKAVA